MADLNCARLAVMQDGDGRRPSHIGLDTSDPELSLSGCPSPDSGVNCLCLDWIASFGASAMRLDELSRAEIQPVRLIYMLNEGHLRIKRWHCYYK